MPDSAALLPQLVTRIAALQATGDTHYLLGLFPSQGRSHALGLCREDSNGFFTALTVFTLQDISARLPPAAQALVAAVAEKARTTYPHYRSRDEQPTYNFYQTRPRNHFPHGRLLRRFWQFAPPDDVDCTVLIYLADPSPAHEATWLHRKLHAHANTVAVRPRTGPAAFRQRKVYSAWFGKHMPIDWHGAAGGWTFASRRCSIITPIRAS